MEPSVSFIMERVPPDNCYACAILNSPPFLNAYDSIRK
jgi:hypothetical protein